MKNLAPRGEEIEKLGGVAAPASANLRIIKGGDISISEEDDEAPHIADKILKRLQKYDRGSSSQGV